jgi:hypothetical protein
MRRLLIATALVCFTAPAFAGEANKSANKSHKTAQTSPLASEDPRQRRAPAVKTGGLLNTGVTPAQAKRVAEQTNRQILRKEIRPQPR